MSYLTLQTTLLDDTKILVYSIRTHVNSEQCMHYALILLEVVVVVAAVLLTKELLLLLLLLFLCYNQ